MINGRGNKNSALSISLQFITIAKWKKKKYSSFFFFLILFNKFDNLVKSFTVKEIEYASCYKFHSNFITGLENW